MRNRSFLITLFLLLHHLVNAQAKIHSHNDYLQQNPFYTAIAEQAYSIEADIFLEGDSLYVAHTKTTIKPGNTLERLYLDPLKAFYATPDFYNFQLVIDVKTSWTSVYPVLLKVLNRYKTLFSNPMRRAIIVISGNRPPDEELRRYPDIINFDGLPFRNYAPPDLKKVVMISDDFSTYSAWEGEGTLPEADKEKLLQVINEARRNRKPVRFWNAPDTPAAWGLLYSLGAHIINTDKIKESSNFLKNIH